MSEREGGGAQQVCVCMCERRPCLVAKTNGLICAGRLEATQTDVFVLLKTLSHTQVASSLNTDKLPKQAQRFCSQIESYYC